MKAIAFKATPSSFDEEESSEDGDEDFAMLIRKVGKMFYKKERQSNFRRGRHQGRFEKKKEEMGPYFHCKKTCHLIADFPSLQDTNSKNVHKKKKAMVAIWDDLEMNSEEEIDAARTRLLHGKRRGNFHGVVHVHSVKYVTFSHLFYNKILLFNSF